MFNKIVYGIVGFGLGAFLFFNSMICAYRFYIGYSQVMGSQEWLASFIMTFLAGIILVFFTQKIIRAIS